ARGLAPSLRHADGIFIVVSLYEADCRPEGMSRNTGMSVTKWFALGSSSVWAARAALGMALVIVSVGGVALAHGGGVCGGGAPEIDPGSAMSALTLLTGGILLITDRIRRRKSSG